ncbi:transcription initiation factor IIE subunit [Echinococcus multilocularis]|uniref:Transcription initiation factor IIE subunit beta n=1 Tax=Echinococcus multilocularis TaxID=6211 RepID=A0A068Y1P5_ECHMU|nr:transcription initiation factor IIE subunit [Echinococcus multilocularis]
MDPSLLKEREEFLRRAKNMPVVEKLRPQVQNASQMNVSPSPSKKPLVSSTREYLTMDIRSQNQGKFALLSRIVKYMRRRHLERDLHPLSVEEILEELQLHETPRSDIVWLENEALPNNPKIASTPDKKFKFMPRYDIRSRNDLYQLLKRHEIRGLGGIYLDDICEAIPDAEKVLQSLGDTVVQVTTPHDKKTVLFFNDKSFDLNVEDEFKQLWRAVSVEGVHEGKIEEYLHRNGIMSMSADKKVFTPAIKQKRRGQRQNNRPVKIRDNEHLRDILRDFSDKKP